MALKGKWTGNKILGTALIVVAVFVTAPILRDAATQIWNDFPVIVQVGIAAAAAFAVVLVLRRLWSSSGPSKKRKSPGAANPARPGVARAGSNPACCPECGAKLTCPTC